jgi:hypothetical protein
MIAYIFLTGSMHWRAPGLRGAANIARVIGKDETLVLFTKKYWTFSFAGSSML